MLQRIFISTGIILLAAFLRFWQISNAPLGLNYDEALNGLVSSQVLNGEHPALLSLDDSREPLHFYLTAISLSILGNTPGALRIPYVICSLILVGFVGLLGKELFDRKIGLLTALLCAFTVWPMYLGRYGTRSVVFAVMIAMALYFAVYASGRRDLYLWIIAGFCFGVSHYTYTVNLFVIPAIIVIVVGMVLWYRNEIFSNWRGMLLMISITVIVALPILLYRSELLAQSFSRPRSLSVFYEGQGFSDLLRTIWIQAVLVMRMFFIRGDANPLHNIPGRPIFDLAMTIPLLWGFVRSISGHYRSRGMLMCAWICVFLLPTFMSKSAPHFLRSVGVLPVLFMVPALGLRGMYNWLKRVTDKFISLVLVSGLLGISIIFSVRDFFINDFLNEPYVFRAYQGDETSLALQINRRLSIGWTGDNLQVESNGVAASVNVWVESEVWDRNRYAEFLVPGQPGEIPGFHLLSSSTKLPNSGGVLFVHPQNTDYWKSNIPKGRTIDLETGPWLFDSLNHTAEPIYQIISW
tara:strand:+ start:107698 stop:109263 length:1566 start_codon:yes stop_codon:yes gene_type:complete